MNSLRSELEHKLDMLEMAAFNQGFEAALNAIDDFANAAHNEGNRERAKALEWLIKELTGNA
jgi:soluble cytochrome b562